MQKYKISLTSTKIELEINFFGFASGGNCESKIIWAIILPIQRGNVSVSFEEKIRNFQIKKILQSL